MFDRKKADISVIVPIYNIDEGYLREALDSLANQTKESIEIIMLDDGSTNNSGEIADEYAEKYENFKCYHIKNKGVGHARNYAIKKAKGEYLGFTDPDDIIAPDTYEKLYRAAKRNDSDMAICNAVRFNSEGDLPSNLHLFTFKNVDTVSHITKNPGFLYDTCLWNKIIRRSVWKKNRIKFDEKCVYEDIPVTIAAHYFSNSVSVIRGVGYKWRIREAGEKSITQGNKTLKNLYDRITILRILDRFFDKNVTQKKLHFEKDVRILTFDLMIFINACLDVEQSRAEEMMKVLKGYVSELSTRKAYGTLNIVEKAVYQAILDDDYERFVKVADFRKKVLPTLPYFEEEGKVFAKLPRDLFNEETVDLTNKVKRSLPRFLINSVKTDEEEATVRTSLFLPKINIADKSEQKVKMQLINEMTGEATPLKVKPFKNSRITASKGKWKCEETGEEGCYNYDGTGYQVKIPLSVLTPENAKNYIILAEYKNRFIKGTKAITNLSKYAIEQ